MLKVSEIKEFLRVDDDFDDSIISGYIEAATSFITQKTDFNFIDEEEVDPQAKLCAKLYIKQLHYSNEYKKDYDFSLGITSLIIDLQDKAIKRLKYE